HQHGGEAQSGVTPDVLAELEPRLARQREIRADQAWHLGREERHGAVVVRRCLDLEILPDEDAADRLALGWVVLDQENRPLAVEVHVSLRLAQLSSPRVQ